MASKIFASPGVSSKPLSLWQRIKRIRLYRFRPQNLWYKWKYRHYYRDLSKALETGGYNPSTYFTEGAPIKVEDIEAAMRQVTFNDRRIKR